MRIKLYTGRIVHANLCQDVNEGSSEQIEFERMQSLTVQDKRRCTPEYFNTCIVNSDFCVGNFAVAEYIGSESSSCNWDPDIDENGLTDAELHDLLEILDGISAGNITITRS